MYESRVEIASHTFQHYTKEVVIGLQDTLCVGITLHVAHTLRLHQGTFQTVVHHNGVILRTLKGIEISHRDMAAKAYDLITDSMFETKNNTNRHYHNGKTDCNTKRSNANGGFRHLSTFVFVAVYLSCYK